MHTPSNLPQPQILETMQPKPFRWAAIVAISVGATINGFNTGMRALGVTEETSVSREIDAPQNREERSRPKLMEESARL